MFSILGKKLFKFLYAFIFLFGVVGTNLAQEHPTPFDSDSWVIYYSPTVIAQICKKARSQHDYPKLEKFSENVVEKIDSEIKNYLEKSKQDDFSNLFGTLISLCKKDSSETSPFKAILKTCVKRVDCCVLIVDESCLDLDDDGLSNGLAVALVMNIPIDRFDLKSNLLSDKIIQGEEEQILALTHTSGDTDTTIYVGLTEVRGIGKSALVFSSSSELVKRKLPLFREDGNHLQETILDKKLACKRILRKGALDHLVNRFKTLGPSNNVLEFIQEALQRLEEVDFSEILQDEGVDENITLILHDADSANDLASIFVGWRTYIRFLLPKNEKLSDEAKQVFDELLSEISVSHEDRQVVIRCHLSFDAFKQGYLLWEKSIPEKL